MGGMTLTMGLMSDYASVDGSGKITLVGVFSRLTYPTFPTVHPMMYVTLKLAISRAEWGTKRQLTVKLIGEDKPVPFQIGPFDLEIPGIQPDDSSNEVPFLFKLDNLEIPKAGNYFWAVLVDNDEKGTIPFEARTV